MDGVWSRSHDLEQLAGTRTVVAHAQNMGRDYLLFEVIRLANWYVVAGNSLETSGAFMVEKKLRMAIDTKN